MSLISTLAPLVGRWVTTITMHYPAEAEGQVSHAVDTYRWLKGERVLIHEVEARMGEDEVHSVEIYTEQNGEILARNFDGQGGVSDYRASMADGVLRIQGDTQRLTSTAVTPDCVEGLWELKTENKWVKWMTVRLHRVSN